MSADLRDYLDQVERAGEVVTISQPVDPRHELAGVLSLLEGGPAVRFDGVIGSAIPVVGNLVNSRERIARALGVDLDGISDALLGSIASPLSPRLRETGRSQELVREADLSALPIPTFFEKESGAYITAGVILVRDALTGERNLSFARFKVLGPNSALLGVSPNHHLGQMAKRGAEAGRDLPIAAAIGVHPRSCWPPAYTWASATTNSRAPALCSARPSTSCAPSTPTSSCPPTPRSCWKGL